jgi:hypothetical protein
MQGSIALPVLQSSTKQLCGRGSLQMLVHALPLLLAISFAEAFHPPAFLGKTPALRLSRNPTTTSTAVFGGYLSLSKPVAQLRPFSLSNRIKPTTFNWMRFAAPPVCPSNTALFAGKQQQDEPPSEDELEDEPPEVFPT